MLCKIGILVWASFLMVISCVLTTNASDSTGDYAEKTGQFSYSIKVTNKTNKNAFVYIQSAGCGGIGVDGIYTVCDRGWVEPGKSKEFSIGQVAQFLGGVSGPVINKLWRIVTEVPVAPKIKITTHSNVLVYSQGKTGTYSYAKGCGSSSWKINFIKEKSAVPKIETRLNISKSSDGGYECNFN